jgi:hypothetical protein
MILCPTFTMVLLPLLEPSSLTTATMLFFTNALTSQSFRLHGLAFLFSPWQILPLSLFEVMNFFTR